MDDALLASAVPHPAPESRRSSPEELNPLASQCANLVEETIGEVGRFSTRSRGSQPARPEKAVLDNQLAYVFISIFQVIVVIVSCSASILNGFCSIFTFEVPVAAASSVVKGAAEIRMAGRLGWIVRMCRMTSVPENSPIRWKSTMIRLGGVGEVTNVRKPLTVW